MNKSILVIAGASGAGKTTVASHLLTSCQKFGFVRSITTRAPRGDSHDGEYIYTDREDFQRRAEAGELVEYMEYGDNYYGTPVSELDRIFGEGKTPLLILDIEGVKSLRKKEYAFSPVIVYIWDDLNVIEKRLYARDLSEPTADKLLSFLKRKEMNRRDYLNMPEIYNLFDAFVRNDGIESCADNIKKIFERIPFDNVDLKEKSREIATKLYKMAESK